MQYESNKDKSPTNANQTSIGGKKGFVGTPYYLAPEIIVDKVITYDGDWWALGIIMFEMLVGGVPYNGGTTEEIFYNIMNDIKDVMPSVGYNDDQISQVAYSLINMLLCRDPAKRLGDNGAAEIKQHPFFQGLNWKTLRSQEPPFVPQPESITDTSYFPAAKAFPTHNMDFHSSANAPLKVINFSKNLEI